MSGVTIDGKPEAELLKICQREIAKKTSPSNVCDEAAERRVTRLDLSEITIGDELGQGGWCVVNNVSGITLSNEFDPDRGAQTKPTGNDFMEGMRQSLIRALSTKSDDDNGASNGNDNKHVGFSDDRQFLASSCIQDGENQYVIKNIKPSALESADTYCSSVLDLALESKYLAVLSHPHIIKMRAMATTSAFGEGGKFFVILDKLDDILPSRMKAWKQRVPMFCSCCFEKEAKASWVERLMIAYDLSTALAYLHKQKLIYRDIKPQNIGFSRNRVVLFDFGLVREMQQKLLTTEGTYLLTGCTGFPPYMAPEVFLRKPYCESCDVFGFCILLWQILEMEQPFGENITEGFFVKNVVNGGMRPKPKNAAWPKYLKASIKDGWDEDITKRPSMDQLSEVLHDAIFEGGGSEHQSLISLSQSLSGKYT